MRIPCTLTFRSNGKVAVLRHARNGLVIARFSVHGPFERNAEAVDSDHDQGFHAEVRGIADYQFIDKHGDIKSV